MGSYIKELDPKGNPKGIIGLINDIENEIFDFQSESIEEDNNLILGLEFIIDKIKKK